MFHTSARSGGTSVVHRRVSPRLKRAVLLGSMTLGVFCGSAVADGYDFPVVVGPSTERELEVVQLGQAAEPEVLTAAPVTLTEVLEVAPVPAPEPVRIAVRTLPEGHLESETQSPTTSGGTASASFADSGTNLSIYAAEKAVRFEYERDRELVEGEHGRLSAGFLMTELRDNVITGTAMLDTLPGLVPAVDLSIGTRVYFALLGTENRDVFGAGLGVRGSYDLPLESFPLNIGASAYYTPDILVFGQSDRIIDLGVDAGLRLRENLSAFVGFRLLQFDTRPGTRRVEDDVHVGLTWHFANEADHEK